MQWQGESPASELSSELFSQQIHKNMYFSYLRIENYVVE